MSEQAIVRRKSRRVMIGPVPVGWMAFNIAALSIGRGIGDLQAPRLYAAGFWLVVIGALGFNLLALVALTRVKILPKA